MTRILIFDEREETIARCLRACSDWELQLVSTLPAAMERLQMARPHLVIVNFTYAEYNDGSQLLEKCEKMFPDIPLILITREEDEESTVNSLQLGAISFIPVSATSYELCHVVTRLLELSRFGRVHQEILKYCPECQFRFELKNERDKIPAIISYLREVMIAVCGAPLRDQMRVAVALEEALQNAIVHGNLEVSSHLREEPGDAFSRAIEARSLESPYKDRQVTIRAEFKNKEAIFEITDQGPGFEVTQLPDPTAPEHLLQPHGRGLLLIRTFMDEIHYNEVGNVLTMHKRFE